MTPNRLLDLCFVILRWPRKRPSKDAAEAYGPSSFEAPPDQIGGSHLRMTESSPYEAGRDVRNGSGLDSERRVVFLAA